jgi:hypothetical protein
MSERVVFALAITIRSPFMFQGLVNTRLGVDVANLRNERGRPIIPRDQVSGILRMAMETLGGAPAWRGGANGKARPGRAASVVGEADIVRLFGEASKPVQPNHPEHDRPERGRLHFGDLEADREAEHGVTTRIEIDDVLGAVKAGALQVIELVATVGTDVTFEGEVTLDADSVLGAERVEGVLRKVLRIIPAIGAFKSAGFGEVVDTNVKIRRRSSLSVAKSFTSSGGETRRAFRITFDRPILVDARRVTDNLFVGCDIVPGAAFKGALAEQLRSADVDPEKDPLWTEALAGLRVSHGFPENDSLVPFGFPVPASTLCGYPDGTRTFGDALLAEPRSSGADGDGFVFGDARKPTLGLFPIDWKADEFSAFAHEGQRFPKYDTLTELPRTHVAIDPDDLVAIDQQLYGTIAKGVLRDPSGKQRSWRVVVDAENVPAECRESLFALWSAGLGPIGRTGAFAAVSEIGSAQTEKDRFDGLRLASPPQADPASADLFAVTLLTPTLMIDPRGTRDERSQYANFWALACGAELVDLFATRSLAGGYIATRRRVYGKAYYPFVLTDAGSVFLLRNPDVPRLTMLLRHGLAPVAISDGRGGTIRLDWRNCPYLPENGFGEFACNLVDHAALAQRVTRV